MLHDNVSSKNLPSTLSLRPGNQHEEDNMFLLGASALLQ